MQLLENCNFRCTNCTGDYCYAVNYKHLNPSLKNEQSYYQVCFTQCINANVDSENVKNFPKRINRELKADFFE